MLAADRNYSRIFHPYVDSRAGLEVSPNAWSVSHHRRLGKRLPSSAAFNTTGFSHLGKPRRCFGGSVRIRVGSKTPSPTACTTEPRGR